MKAFRKQQNLLTWNNSKQLLYCKDQEKMCPRFYSVTCKQEVQSRPRNRFEV